jgi:hypothetical protein
MLNSECGARTFVAAWAGALATCAVMLGCPPAQADSVPAWLSSTAPRGAASSEGAARHNDIDTEHIFGFTMGSDIGEKGEIESEMENVAGAAKRAGRYLTFTSLNLLKYTMTDTFRVAPGVAWGANSISNVPGYDSRSHGALQGAVLEFRYKLLDRDTMPFGLTLHAQPGWNRVDEMTALRVEAYGSEFALLADKEIIKDRLWTAVNLWYGLGASKQAAVNAWEHGSDLEFHVAASTRLTSALVMGGELRYLRTYDGLGLNGFLGEALYLGPTFSWNMCEHAGLSGTVNFQVAGGAKGDPRWLDLDNYERVQGMLRFNMHF